MIEFINVIIDYLMKVTTPYLNNPHYYLRQQSIYIIKLRGHQKIIKIQTN